MPLNLKDMSDLLREFQLRIKHDYHIEDNTIVTINIGKLTNIVLRERIQAFQDADQVCLDAMMEFARQQSTPITPEVALENWEKTIWHKLIAGKIFKLKELLKELEA